MCSCATDPLTAIECTVLAGFTLRQQCLIAAPDVQLDSKEDVAHRAA